MNSGHGRDEQQAHDARSDAPAGRAEATHHVAARSGHGARRLQGEGLEVVGGHGPLAGAQHLRRAQLGVLQVLRVGPADGRLRLVTLAM